MSEELTCPNGHHWSATTISSEDKYNVCPVCKAQPVTVDLTEADRATSAGTEMIDDLTHKSANDAGPVQLGGLKPGTHFANYEILSRLGRGGMGVVYKARQRELKRTVALKLISAGADAEPTAIARFHAEAKVVAQLHHPNIVQIYDVGNDNGNPYLSLEYVAGGTLGHKLRRTLPTSRQAAQMIEQLARAVHYAHDRGVVHRDLKPANILLANEDNRETPRDGPAPPLAFTTPKITDFGLAKFLRPSTHETNLTKTGAVLGTPNYMAPEQAEGKNHLVGPATDIYALGSILFEMLTGQPPFASSNIMETLHKVINHEPPSVSKLQAGVPQDLQTICMTCLQKDPARRYPSAQMLADDLQAFLAGDPILARPVSTWERFVKWVRQRPALALAVATGAVVFFALAIGAWFYNALAVGLVAVVSLFLGAAWFSARLKSAMFDVKQQQLRAERNIERMNLLLETTQRLMTAVNIEEILKLLGETTTRMTNAERATIYVVDYEHKEIWSKVLVTDDDLDEIRIPLGEGIAGTVAETGETIILADPYQDARFNPEIDKRTGYVTRNMITLPILSRSGRTLGVFQILNKRDGLFGGEDVEILHSLATSAALVLETGIVQI